MPRVKVKNENIAARAGNEMYFFGADDEFLETYQIKLISGRNFLKGSSVDSGSVIVNETAAKELGIVQALGQNRFPDFVLTVEELPLFVKKMIFEQMIWVDAVNDLFHFCNRFGNLAT